MELYVSASTKYVVPWLDVDSSMFSVSVFVREKDGPEPRLPIPIRMLTTRKSNRGSKAVRDPPLPNWKTGPWCAH